MSDRQEQIDAYVEMWNETDADRRLELVQAVWTDDGYYVDPTHEARGHAEISDNVVRVQQKYPDRVFGRTSDVYIHNDRARFAWAMLDPAGSPTIAGVYYVEFTDDNRIRRVIGIYDRKPVKAEALV